MVDDFYGDAALFWLVGGAGVSGWSGEEESELAARGFFGGFLGWDGVEGEFARGLGSGVRECAGDGTKRKLIQPNDPQSGGLGCNPWICG